MNKVNLVNRIHSDTHTLHLVLEKEPYRIGGAVRPALIAKLDEIMTDWDCQGVDYYFYNVPNKDAEISLKLIKILEQYA